MAFLSTSPQREPPPALTYGCCCCCCGALPSPASTTSTWPKCRERSRTTPSSIDEAPPAEWPARNQKAARVRRQRKEGPGGKARTSAGNDERQFLGPGEHERAGNVGRRGRVEDDPGRLLGVLEVAMDGDRVVGLEGRPATRSRETVESQYAAQGRREQVKRTYRALGDDATLKYRGERVKCCRHSAGDGTGGWWVSDGEM